MPSRAGHTKSRNGCLRCKQRRVKCDEQRPCRDCTRRGEICSLVDQTQPAQSLSHHIATPALSHSPYHDPSPESDAYPFLVHLNIDAQQSPTNPLDWSQDLFLMHYYSTSTCITLSNRRSVQHLFQTIVPETAVSYPFVMHGLLTLAALHLAHERPLERRKYAMLSTHHQGAALQHFRAVLPAITHENCSGIFIMSCTLSIISLSAISWPEESELPSLGLHSPSIDDIVELFELTRGVREVLGIPTWAWLQDDPVSVVFHGHSLEDYEAHTLPEDIRRRFRSLREEVIPSLLLDDNSELEHYIEALEELEKVYKDIMFVPRAQDCVNPHDHETGVVLKYTTSVPAQFVTLLRERKTAALVILAHYVVTFKALGENWYLNKWSENALRMIRDVMPPNALVWLKWPEQLLQKL